MVKHDHEHCRADAMGHAQQHHEVASNDSEVEDREVAHGLGVSRVERGDSWKSETRSLSSRRQPRFRDHSRAVNSRQDEQDEQDEEREWRIHPPDA